MLTVVRKVRKCPSRERLFDSLRLGSSGPTVTIHCVGEEFVHSGPSDQWDDHHRATAMNSDEFTGQIVDIKRLNDQATLFLVELELTGIGSTSVFRIFAYLNTEERNKCGPLYLVWPAEGEPRHDRSLDRWRFIRDMSEADLEEELFTLRAA